MFSRRSYCNPAVSAEAKSILAHATRGVLAATIGKPLPQCPLEMRSPRGMDAGFTCSGRSCRWSSSLRSSVHFTLVIWLLMVTATLEFHTCTAAQTLWHCPRDDLSIPLNCVGGRWQNETDLNTYVKALDVVFRSLFFFPYEARIKSVYTRICTTLVDVDLCVPTASIAQSCPAPQNGIDQALHSLSCTRGM